MNSTDDIPCLCSVHGPCGAHAETYRKEDWLPEQFVNIVEAVKRACEEPTFVKALTWLAVWENDRAVNQALEWKRTGKSTAGNGGGWDTCFEVTFDRLLAEWKGPFQLPKGCRELQIEGPDGSRAFTITVVPK